MRSESKRQTCPWRAKQQGEAPLHTTVCAVRTHPQIEYTSMPFDPAHHSMCRQDSSQDRVHFNAIRPCAPQYVPSGLIPRSSTLQCHSTLPQYVPSGLIPRSSTLQCHSTLRTTVCAVRTHPKIEYTSTPCAPQYVPSGLTPRLCTVQCQSPMTEDRHGCLHPRGLSRDFCAESVLKCRKGRTGLRTPLTFSRMVKGCLLPRMIRSLIRKSCRAVHNYQAMSLT